MLYSHYLAYFVIANCLLCFVFLLFDLICYLILLHLGLKLHSIAIAIAIAGAIAITLAMAIALLYVHILLCLLAQHAAAATICLARDACVFC